MADYISRDDVRSMILKYRADNPKKQTVWAMVISDMLRDLKEIPAADVQPVRHGKWIEVSPKHSKCSCCETTCLIAQYPISANANFCPNCGADMRGEDNG